MGGCKNNLIYGILMEQPQKYIIGNVASWLQSRKNDLIWIGKFSANVQIWIPICAKKRTLIYYKIVNNKLHGLSQEIQKAKISRKILMFALMREYISTYLYTVYDVMATNINVVLWWWWRLSATYISKQEKQISSSFIKNRRQCIGGLCVIIMSTY